jgi:hypothetical protein
MNIEAKRIIKPTEYRETRRTETPAWPLLVDRQTLGRVIEAPAVSRESPTALRYLNVIRPREPSRITVQIASTPALMETVYRLRHDSYVAQGFLEPRVSGLFSDTWDELPHCFSMLSFVDGEPAASVRISHCQPAAPRGERTETTAMELFKPEIENLAESFRAASRPATVMEMSRLTRHPDFSESNSDPMFGIFRANFYCLLKTEADMLISAVRAHHMPFYKRLGFQKITEPRPYPKLKFETALMACFRHSYDAIQNSIPIFQGIDKNDSVYDRLFAGERVGIFDEMPARREGR